MKLRVKELENGMLIFDKNGFEIDIIKDISYEEFIKKFPEKFIQITDWTVHAYLENGETLHRTEWIGEVYFSEDCNFFKPVYITTDEDIYNIAGYIIIA